MQKFKILSRYRYRFIYIAIVLTGTILVINHLIYLIVYIPLLYYIVRKHRDLISISLVVLGIYGLSMLFFNLNTIQNSGQYQVKVNKYIKYSDYCKIEGRVQLTLVNVYTDCNSDVLIGSSYNIVGSLDTPESATIPNTFDYKEYLRSKNVKYIINAESIAYDHKSFSISQLSEIVNSYIERYLPESKAYIKTFIIADKEDIDQDVLNNIKVLGISHLFAVSGYHIGLLVVGLSSILTKMKVSGKIVNIVLFTILLTYLVITNFTASVTRAVLLFIFININKKYNLKLSVLDVLSIIFIGLLIVQPYYYYNIGFVLSFLMTYVLIFSSRLLKKSTKGYSIILVSFIAFLATFPVVLNANYKINLFTIIANIITVMIMSVVVLPATYITFLFPLFDNVLSKLYALFEGFIETLSYIDTFIIRGYISNQGIYIIIFIMVYSIFARMEQNRSVIVPSISIVFLCVISFNLQFLIPYQQVVFLDVYGDSTLIQDSYGQCTVLIDTGETDSYDSVLHYLYSKNIRRIDYIVVSHFHSDHYGEMNDILNKVNISHIISSNNVDLYHNEMIQCGNLKLFIYPLSYSSVNENNNSIIMSVLVKGDHYLFVGDSEVEREIEFISEFSVDVDVLKVGHHGSATSSTSDFLEHIIPEEAVIIVHRSNRNRHPDNTVITRLQSAGIIVSRTDIEGTIEYTYFLDKKWKKTYQPQ